MGLVGAALPYPDLLRGGLALVAGSYGFMPGAGVVLGSGLAPWYSSILTTALSVPEVLIASCNALSPALFLMLASKPSLSILVMSSMLPTVMAVCSAGWERSGLPGLVGLCAPVRNRSDGRTRRPPERIRCS